MSWFGDLFSGGETVQTQNVDMGPWGGAQPNIDYGLGQAKHIYDTFSPTAFGSTVTPFNAYQNAALSGIANRATAGNPLEAQAQGVAGNQMNNAFSPALSWLGGAMTNPAAGAGMATPFALNDIQAAGGMNPASGYFGNTVGGNYLNSNPYLDQMFDAQTDAMTRKYREATAPTTAAGFSGSGRLRGGDAARGGYNSAVARNESELMSGLERAGSNVYGGAYNMERGLQQNAANTLGNQWLSQLGLGQNATGNLANIANAGFGNQLNAAGMLGGQYAQGLNNQLNAATSGMNFAQQDYNNLQHLYNAGLTQQQQGDRQLADQARVHDFYQTGQGSPWANFANLWNPSVQAGGLGQTGTTTSTSQYNPGGLDYLSMGLNAAGQIGSMAMGMPPGMFGGGGTPLASTGSYSPYEAANIQAVNPGVFG